MGSVRALESAARLETVSVTSGLIKVGQPVVWGRWKKPQTMSILASIPTGNLLQSQAS